MAISINPADIWRMVKDSRTKNKEQIAQWLDGVAADARELATIWTQTYEKICAGPLTALDARRVYGELGFYKNIRPNYRLRRFYETASTVIGNRVEQDTLDELFDDLGNMLKSRDMAETIHGAILAQFNDMRFCVDDENSEEDVKDFGKLVIVMNREAAALEVLAKNFRASL